MLKYVRRNGLSYPNLLDTNGEVSALYGVNSTPTKFLIDTEGNIAGMALGYRKWDTEEIKSLIKLLIEKGR